MRYNSLAVAAIGAIAVFGATYSWAPAARACGGTFCDQPASTTETTEGMPVDQTGETIIFVVEDDHVEAHIQIQYDPGTDAERLAWLVPVMGEPEIAVGSEQLFIDALNGTVPAYGLQVTTQSCGGGGGGGGDGGGSGECSSGGNDGGWETGDDGGGSDSEGGVDTTDGGTEVVAQASVGAFDYVVLRSETADELMMWLGDNEFQQDPAALPILEEYVAEGALFVAFRLRQLAETAEIHPVAIRYAGTEACVPIRLTQVAAQDDMDIRVLFFGDGRVVPTNYRHVEINPLLVDWFDPAANYKDVVTLAVDAEGADGHGFVTEYAGPSPLVDPLFSESWDAEPFARMTPSEMLAELEAQGFGSCVDDVCDWQHPLLGGLLQSLLPVPEGVEPDFFYSCLTCYDDFIDMDAWDPVAVSHALEERIMAPARHAQEIVDTYPYLTRMYTTLSPHEMTEDPFFHENPDLLDQDLTQTRASINRRCSGAAAASVPATPASFAFESIGGIVSWPIFEDMPAALRVEEIPEVGAPIVLVDNDEKIREALAAWTSMWSPATVDPRCGDTTPFDDEPTQVDREAPGCACRADGWGGPLGAAGTLVMFCGLLGARRRAPAGA